MPLNPRYTDIVALAKRPSGPTADAMESRFFSPTGGGLIRLVEGTKSSYVSGAIENGIVKFGTISIGIAAVDSVRDTIGVDLNSAATLIAVHEMGHAFYQQRAYSLSARRQCIYGSQS